MANARRRGPGRPPAAKGGETRERIVRAAREVFSEFGYDSSTYQEIAARADLTRPAINHYFPSKRMLYGEVVAVTIRHEVCAALARARQYTTLVDRIDAFLGVGLLKDAEEQAARAFLVIAVLEAQHHPELREQDNDLLESTREFITWVVDDAIAAKEVRADVQRESLIELLIAVLWGVGFHAGFIASPADPIRVTDTLKLLLQQQVFAV